MPSFKYQGPFSPLRSENRSTSKQGKNNPSKPPQSQAPKPSVGSTTKGASQSNRSSRLSNEPVTEEWFQRYNDALKTGILILSDEAVLCSIKFSNLDRLSYFLDNSEPDKDAYWRIMWSSLGCPKTTILYQAAFKFKELSSALRRKDIAAAEKVVLKIRQLGIVKNLRQASNAFSKGRSSLNKRVQTAMAKQSKSTKVSTARQVAEQATRSHLTTPEYKITKGTVKPLPGSYGSRQ